jgi:carboxysome shell carbonic anhydrase
MITRVSQRVARGAHSRLHAHAKPRLPGMRSLLPAAGPQPLPAAAASAAQWAVAAAPSHAVQAVAHPLADPAASRGLAARAQEITAAFSRIEPILRELAAGQFQEDFAAVATARIQREFGITLPAAAFAASWVAPLDARRLYGRVVIGTFCRLIERDFDRSHATLSEGEPALELIRRWGFHAIDVTPCADGRLSGVVDYILRIPPAVIAYRKSYAGAMFDVEESLRHWETVELRRWREGRPNSADAPTRFLKIGVYHYSSVEPLRQGCAAHGSDTGRAAGALLGRLQQLEQAVEMSHCCGARIASLLIGVDTDTDAIRVHVPGASGAIATERFVDNLSLYEATRGLEREQAKAAIRAAVAECAGVPADDPASEGMRWFCGYLLKNNIAQIDAVRAWHGGTYADRGHTERLLVVGDAVDDVQLRNLAFQAQMETVEEGSVDLDIGLKILRGLHEPRSLAVPVLVHLRYDPRVPGARERAEGRARRLQSAIEARHAAGVAAGAILVQAVVRAGDAAHLDPVEPLTADRDCACSISESHP